MNTNKPDWNDVYDLKEGFNAWRRTYKYRGIEYDIAMLYNSPSRYFVVELPEETRRISKLVDSIDIRHDFLYCVCDRDESLREMFYDAVNRAESDIDWFLDDAANDLAARMKKDRALFSDIIDERRLLIGAYTNMGTMATNKPIHEVLSHDINDIWGESDNPVQMIDELDTIFTDEIVCPHCGYVFSESYEYIGEDIVECPECERKFELVSEEYVVYTTSKVDWLKQWRTYNRAQIHRAEWKIWRDENTVKVVFNE